jgi:hypothetical protein
MAKLVLTVDVEGHKGKKPVEHLMLGKTIKGEEFGALFIQREFEKRGLNGVFFVDFCMFNNPNEFQLLLELCRILADKDALALHIHPDHLVDAKRKGIYEYSEEEKKNIFKYCLEKYHLVSNKSPSFFRAGMYSADIDTIDLLPNSILYDLSENRINHHCKIDFTHNRNLPSVYKNIIEIPACVVPIIDFFGHKKSVKLDLGLPHPIFKHFINVIMNDRKYDDHIISIFLHSHSLLNWRLNPDRPKKSNLLVRGFIKNLDYLKKWNNEIVDETFLIKNHERFLNYYSKNEDVLRFKDNNFFWAIWFSILLFFSSLKNNKKNIFLFTIAIVFFAIVIGMVVLLCLLL